MSTRGGKPYVPFTAVAAFCHQHLLPVFEHVANQSTAFFVANKSAKRHFDKHILTAFPKAFLRAAHSAVFREIARSKTEREQVVHVLIPNEIYVAALTAVAAVRTASRLAFVGFEGVHAVAAVPCFY